MTAKEARQKAEAVPLSEWEQNIIEEIKGRIEAAVRSGRTNAALGHINVADRVKKHFSNLGYKWTTDWVQPGRDFDVINW